MNTGVDQVIVEGRDREQSRAVSAVSAVSESCTASRPITGKLHDAR